MELLIKGVGQLLQSLFDGSSATVLRVSFQGQKLRFPGFISLADLSAYVPTFAIKIVKQCLDGCRIYSNSGLLKNFTFF